MRFNQSRGEWNEPKERIPPLWEQINAGRKSGQDGRSYAPQRVTEIQGRATVVTPARAEGEPNIGDRVTHEKFGLGTVRRVDHDKLEVAFDKKGILKVMAGFVTLVS